MDNEIWGRASQFLKELRCENTARNSIVNLPEYNKALKTKSRCYKEYEKAVRKISDEEQEKIKQYMDAV